MKHFELSLMAIGLGFSLLLAAGCALTTDTVQCSKRDWYELGRRDGAQGQALDKIDQYAGECGRSSMSEWQTIYVNGRNAGLVEYCLPENAFELGRTAIPYWNVCPSTSEPSFLAAYRKGQNSLALESENRKLDQQIAILADQKNHAGSGFDKRRIEKEMMQLKKLRAQNTQKLNKSSE